MSRHVLGIFLFYFVFFFYFVFLLCDRTFEESFVISSPLQGHRPRCVFYDVPYVDTSVNHSTLRPSTNITINFFFFTIIIIINVIIRIDRNTRRFDPETLLVWGHQHRRIIGTDFLSATETVLLLYSLKNGIFWYESSISRCPAKIL